ncbi:transglycosylase domain-containing protein [Streptomyces litchfieldiae]|uniref:Transglycosylase domain-containing protein n=1 Tax=Streptomyces litchfieldiae TaxID=3075543 RepID=A0ABU2MKM2_9ACTN|nr:transglycosylase domain-containing protein [Streptomyces sp. DSM 44938]MDT0341923.1 transglycosylase domain-containing protein [Streptomyces sp. DSM 44938]
MSRKRPGGGLSAAQQAAKFLGVSVLSGAVLAGIALPAVGALGLAARGTMEGFDEIPAMMERPPLSEKTTILDAEGNKIADVYSRNRTVVPLDQMSDHLRQAIVAIEDARFYEHGAVDLRGILRALTQNVESGAVEQGASTLTQQYVKNVFVEAAGDDQEAVAEATIQTGAAGLGRKIREMKYAIQLEQELTKDQILENYLNITYFGQQAYGAEAAAQRYFSKSAADLELHEAALLAGLVQSPSQYDPLVDEQAAVDRRNTVLQSMVRTGDITQAEADEAKARDLGLNVSEPRQGCITAVNDAGFFCDYVREEFLNSPVFGETRDERQAIWDLGGLTIQTTLDPTAQQAAAQAAKDHVYAEDEVVGSVVQVQPGTGRILSMAQSLPYGTEGDATSINFNVSADMRGTANGFQPGSTFKPFTAAAALEAGISPAQEYTTDWEHSLPNSDFRTCENEPYQGNTPDYEFVNEREDERGTWDMTSALAQSINTYFVELERQVGLCETITMAGDLGVERGSGEPLTAQPSVTLGAQETTPLMMASAYAAFANRGTYCEPIAITLVTDADGEEMPVPESECRQVMSEHTADTINQMLSGVVEDGTGQAVGLTDRDNAGKTGTADERKDVWFVGYTPELSTAVHVGGRADQVSMVDITIGGQYFERASGAGVAGPIWNQAMTGALAGTTPTTFNPVDVPRGDDRRGDGDRDDDNGGDNGDNGGGGEDNAGGGDGGVELPDWPDVEWPPDIFEGTNQGNGNGNGGRD